MRDELQGRREKLGYLLNVIEQSANLYAEQEKLPVDYYELQDKPVLKTLQLPFAADDGPVKGQVYRMSLVESEVRFRFKYPDEDGGWRWTPDVTFPLPKVIDPTLPLAPTLRVKEVKGGESIVVLDFIVEENAPPSEATGENVLSFDWGVRKLLTFVILSRTEGQLTPPSFTDIGGLAGKQMRLREQIDRLKAKRSRLKKKERGEVQAEIDACWRKYHATNEALAHFASNLLLINALLFDCNLIAGEWLKTLKARKKKGRKYRKQRTIRWKVNTTIREAIWKKLAYKVKRFSLATQRVRPFGTSHECPRCGKRGVTCKSPEHRHQVSRYGRWFFCRDPECGYNADRDYVASLNIGRRALNEAYPSDERNEVECQPVSYTGAGAALPFPSPGALRELVRCASTTEGMLNLSQGGRVRESLLGWLATTLFGFDKAITVSPLWLPGYG